MEWASLSVFAKTIEKRRVPQADLPVDAKAEIIQPTDPIAVMQRRRGRVAVVNERFVIAAAGADRPRPAGMTVAARSNVMRIETLLARRVTDASFLHVSHLSHIGIDKGVTEIDVARRSDAQQTEAGAARICLADAAVQLLQRVVHIRETMMASGDRPVDRKSTRLNSSHGYISYAVFCLKKKNERQQPDRAILIEQMTNALK